MGMISEFKKFAMGGSLVDVAIAFVMGMAFNKVITTFTGGIVSPLIGLITGKDFSTMKAVLRESTEVKDEAGAVISGLSEISMMYGELIMAIIDFIIIAFICFMIIKKVMKKDPNAVPPTPANEVLLAEIRDLLKK
jgi:large conductance mechanosensitive channel